MNISRRSFLWSSAASVPFFIAGCAVNRGPRRIAANAKVNVGSYDYKGKVPDCLRNFKESDLTDKDVKLYRPNAGHDGSEFHESDFLDGILEGRTDAASTCEMGHRTITMAHIANICERMQLKSLKWDPEAEVFTGAYADEANRYLEGSYHNGWELGA